MDTEVRVLDEAEEVNLGVEVSAGISLENDSSTSLSVLDDGRSEFALSVKLKLFGSRRLSLGEDIHYYYILCKI